MQCVQTVSGGSPLRATPFLLLLLQGLWRTYLHILPLVTLHTALLGCLVQRAGGRGAEGCLTALVRVCA